MSKGFITIDVKGLKDIENYYRSLNKNSQAAMKVEVTDLAQQVVGAMKADAPVDVARLKNSISFKQEDLTLLFYASADYAPYMEWGTKSKVKVPSYVGTYASEFQGKSSGSSGTNALQALTSWVRRKGIVATYSTTTKKRTKRNKAEAARETETASRIMWSIKKFGVKPHPFFFTTKSGQNRLEIIKDKYKAALKQGLKNLIK